MQGTQGKREKEKKNERRFDNLRAGISEQECQAV